MPILILISKKNRRGESFIEVLIALFVISLIVIVSLNLLLSSTDLTTSNRNNLVAENLANEASEAITNIIASNVLKYGNENSEQCWLTYPTDINGQLFTADQCENNQIVNINSPTLGDSYLLRYYDELDLHWDIDRSEAAVLDLENAEDQSSPFRLYVSTLTNGDPDSEANTYYYTNEENDTPSIFYRSVSLSLDPILPNEAIALIKVQWREGNRIRRIEKAATYKRDNFSQ